MKKPIKISGYVLKFGEEIEPGTIISKDCKINLPKRDIFIQQDFNPYKIIGSGSFIMDENGVKYEGEVSILEIVMR